VIAFVKGGKVPGGRAGGGSEVSGPLLGGKARSLTPRQ